MWFPIFGIQLSPNCILGLPVSSVFPSFFPSIICRFDIFGVDIRIRTGGRASGRMNERTRWYRVVCWVRPDPVACVPLLAQNHTTRHFLWLFTFTLGQQHVIKVVIKLSKANFPIQGCVNLAFWLPLATGASFMQPLREKYALQCK